MIINPRKDAQRLLLVILGSVLFAFNINSFVQAAGLFPGGFSGLTLLLQAISERYLNIAIPYTPINLLLNAFPAWISYKFIGKKFTLLSCLAIVLTSVFTDIMPSVAITSDPLLVCIFGGLLSGLAVLLCLNAGATSGGTDFISIYFSEKTGKDAFNYILAGNVLMLGVAGLLFGWERALYSIIFQFASTQVLHTQYKRYQQLTLLVISEKPEEIYRIIKQITNHGATLFKGTGLYENKERTMVYSVVSADECNRVIRSVHEVEPTAFVNVLKTASLSGRFYRKPND